MKYAILFLVTLTVIKVEAQKLTRASIDLVNVTDDKVKVKIDVPKVSLDSIEFQIPKVVPGTYSISDFGRFVDSLSAYNINNKALRMKRLSTNRWMIYDATELKKIEYWVDDTFDKAQNYNDNYVFEPGGTNIDEKNEVFIINPFGFVGYIEGTKMDPFELTIYKNPKWYGSTSLTATSLSDSADIYQAKNYHYLVDNPLMYCKPDTITKDINGTKVLVSVYSPRKMLSAEEIMDNIFDLMLAQTEYLGGELPVDKYSYLIYLTNKQGLSGSMGALEHSYSSVYYLPEARGSYISKTIRDVAAHEFLHIVTPLNIHSEDIHNFNYINPSMSKHLWLYEGVTEYSSIHVQVRSGLYSPEEFLSEIRSKLFTADNFPSISFTEMSENILEEDYEPYFSNVYYKGALIAMCLDLYLLKYTDGEMDLPGLLSVLSKTYGPDKPFDDDSLFDLIGQLTSEEIKNFFTKYVEGNEELPLTQCLSWVGVDYSKDFVEKKYSLGNIGFMQNEDGSRLKIVDISEMNDFGVEMGYKKDDILLSVNGDEIYLDNAAEVFENFQNNIDTGKKVKVQVLREINGETKVIKLKAKAMSVETTEKHKLEFAENPSDDALNLRNKWLNGL
jgi:predicted metalloprotease with PDZ domain